MFYNMGKKIRALAVTLCWIGIGVFVISGLVAICLGFASHTLGLIALGILVLILGPLFSWLSIFVLYAFGDLVENVQEIKEQLYLLEDAPDISGPEESSEPKPETLPEPTKEPVTEAEPEIEPVIAFDAEQPQDSSEDYTPDDSQKEKYYEKYFS